ncbi:MAG: hypothetical protein AB7S38_27565 [Vulcanimicrobiota bacterium]
MENELRAFRRIVEHSCGELASVARDQFDFEELLNEWPEVSWARHGSRRRYEYDSLDRITRVTFGDGKTIDYSYSRESELLRMVDPNGNATRYEYQNDGLHSKVIIERDSSDVGEFVYSYDAAGRLAEIVYPTDSEIVAKFDDGAMTPGPGWNQNGQLTCLRYEKDGTEILRFEQPRLHG